MIDHLAISKRCSRDNVRWPRPTNQSQAFRACRFYGVDMAFVKSRSVEAPLLLITFSPSQYRALHYLVRRVGHRLGQTPIQSSTGIAREAMWRLARGVDCLYFRNIESCIKKLLLSRSNPGIKLVEWLGQTFSSILHT